MAFRITHFMRRPRPNVFSIERLYEDIRVGLPHDCRATIWTCRNASLGLLPRLKDIWAARKAQGDVNHVTGDVHYLTFLLDPKRTVLTIHDLVSLKRLEGIRRWIVWLLWYWLPTRRCSVIVTISETTRAALLESVRCDPAKVRVIHNNVSDEFLRVERPFNVEAPRILHIGTKPNKNLERLAEALQGIPCKLTVIGQLSKAQIVSLRRHGIEYENYVGLSRSDLVAQYAAADMLVFASTYEGFGLPIVEAQAVGRPVVTSNISAMPEIAGAGACLIDPFDVTSIRAGVQRIVEDPDYREQLVEAGHRNVERFRTTTVAGRYAEIYREVKAKSK